MALKIENSENKFKIKMYLQNFSKIDTVGNKLCATVDKKNVSFCVKK